MSVAVSIVSFNTKELLKNCLSDLEKQTVQLDIWVLDNNSSDGSIEMVKKEFPKVNLIKSDLNLGFAKGQNKILKQLKNDFILVLNPDTKLEKDSIEGMVKFMDEHSDCGISSGKIVGFDGKLHSNGGDLPFGWALFDWLFNLKVLGNLPNFHKTNKSYFDKSHQVGWIGGTFMMIKKEVLEKVGYFNEDYFMYFEDTELCFLVKKNGYQVMINPDVTIKHASGASSKDPNLRQWSGEFWGLIHFYKKYFGNMNSFFVRILVIKAILLRIIAFALVGKLNKSITYGKILFML